MPKEIEILVGDETIIYAEGRQFNVGAPQRISLEGKTNLEIMYHERVIPASVEEQLKNFSSLIGINSNIISGEGVYLPENRDLYFAKIPTNYNIRIRTSN